MSTVSKRLINAVDHTPKLVQSHDVHHLVHGSGMVGRFNTRTAMVASNLLSSMYFFWFCVVLDLVELPAVIQANSVLVWVAYVSQTVIQLLALPALGAGQRLSAVRSDAEAVATHETLTALHTMNVTQLRILSELRHPQGTIEVTGHKI